MWLICTSNNVFNSSLADCKQHRINSSESGYFSYLVILIVESWIFTLGKCVPGGRPGTANGIVGIVEVDGVP